MSRAVSYNTAILQQSIDLLGWCIVSPDRARFADAVGPHLRHVLEHYEELLDGLGRRVLEYDKRRRDRLVETDATVALARFRALVDRLRKMVDGEALPDDVAVMLCGGIDGGDNFVTLSTPARELLFVASHAVHHYAIIKPVLADRGYAVGADFGKAPATIHYERQVECEAAN